MSLKRDDVATQTQYCSTRRANSLRIAVVHRMDGPMFVYKEMLRIGSFLWLSTQVLQRRRRLWIPGVQGHRIVSNFNGQQKIGRSQSFQLCRQFGNTQSEGKSFQL
jgi:hypothetical protein